MLVRAQWTSFDVTLGILVYSIFENNKERTERISHRRVRIGGRLVPRSRFEELGAEISSGFVFREEAPRHDATSAPKIRVYRVDTRKCKPCTIYRESGVPTRRIVRYHAKENIISRT